jgi:ribose 5-phosphate isomerase B
VRIALAADHNGTALKRLLLERLAAAGHTAEDLGAREEDGTVDYPPLCAAVCARVASGAADRGVVIGGSGMGETIACNKVRGIRAGLGHDEWSTAISRGNNDSNVLVLPAKTLTPDRATALLTLWLTTPFKGGVHARRVAMITSMETAQPR